MNEIITYPKPLQPGDKIAIVSPAGIVNPDYVHAAMRVLSNEGWNPYIGTHTLGKQGSFSGSINDRLNDLKEAFFDADTRAIFCSRGGYGTVHLLDDLSALPLERDPKWLIGFSDISALHALMNLKGIASIHAPMAKHLARENGTDSNSYQLFEILRGRQPQYQWASHPLNRCGSVSGKLVGGNLAVLQALINTPYDVFKKGIILFIEDIGEPVYKVQRMLYQLKFSGILQSLKGLIVGQFTNYNPDANFPDMETMIGEITASYNYPVTFNAPIGHVNNNIPLIIGSEITLSVTSKITRIN